jgi:hypothetical protein
MSVVCRLFALLLLFARGERSKQLEPCCYATSLSILGRRARRPQLTKTDRLVLGP